MKILVSAYACCPEKGSEPGMGWNFVIGLAKFHEVHVIVEKLKWEQQIKKFLNKNSSINKNLKFYFIVKKRNKFLRKIWPPSYYWFYKGWQLSAFNLAKKLDKVEDFDVIHQLNMVGYREPGFLWKIKKPFVWGPIGGLENAPLPFLPKLGLHGFIFYLARNTINSIQRKFLLRPKLAARHTQSKLISATPETANLIKRLWQRNSEIICEVGHLDTNLQPIKKRDINTPLKIIWSGVHSSRKNLPLLLDALAITNINFELHILGSGELTDKWKNYAISNGVNDKCYWHGWLKHKESIEIMKTGDLFCITSISDLTSTVTIEALSCGLPIICLDHCGFSYVVNEKCGIKVQVKSYKKAVFDFAHNINLIGLREDIRYELSRGALKRAKDFKWDKKIDKINNIYDELLNKSDS